MKRRYLIALAVFFVALGALDLLGKENLDESTLSTPEHSIATEASSTAHSHTTPHVAPTNDAESEEEPLSNSLYGRISDPKGGRIPNARLELDGPIRASSVSDVNGDYRVAGLPSGTYRMQVDHDLYESASRRLRIRENKQLEITLPWITIRGAVSGQGIGIPIENFSTYWSHANRPNDTGDKRQQFHQTGGAFTLEYTEHKYDAIRIIANGYTAKVVPFSEFTKSDDSLVKHIELTPKAGIVGRVVNEEKKAIEGARIFRTTSRNNPEQARDHTLAYSANDGRFRIHAINSRLSYIVATHLDYASAYTVYDAEIEMNEYVITLPQASSLSGTVTYQEKPVAETTIQINALDSDAFGEWRLKTDLDGSYHVDNIPAGTFMVDCDGDGKVYGEPITLSGNIREKVSVGAGEDVTQDFDLPFETGQLEGNLYFDHDAIEEVAILAESVDQEIVIRKEADSPTKESFLFNTISPGKWDVIAVTMTQLGISLSRHRVTVLPDEVTVFDINLGQYSGEITGTLYNLGESILILYNGKQDYDGDTFFRDVHRLMGFEEIPPNFNGFYLTGFNSGSGNNAPFTFANLADGDYTLLGSNAFETPFLLNAQIAPYIMEHITIRNGESVQVDIEF